MYKCPVCGAPVEGEKCEYCGCVIYDFANIDCDKPSYIRIRMGNQYITMKAIAVNPVFEFSSDTTDVCDCNGNVAKTFVKNRNLTVKLELNAVIDNNNDHLCEMTISDKPYREAWRDDIES